MTAFPDAYGVKTPFRPLSFRVTLACEKFYEYSLPLGFYFAAGLGPGHHDAGRHGTQSGHSGAIHDSGQSRQRGLGCSRTVYDSGESRQRQLSRSGTAHRSGPSRKRATCGAGRFRSAEWIDEWNQ
jgi:hypothetical protein